ncbi:hypothetical protein FIV42_12210 [Persicimonas caeni]|uniref:Exo-alpha-sialidase n=1 Tax=Persicimonas caeni TaxID=2292766 RepID=A0A4Y6PT40_PERCE|nr:hypothetical protein [Persicimonas caeni]QDG51481.1 hypothetical protein FIV42_12210 [Persicimonas caeni]QED32702.1 hypothetical protein FRD00_12205 [Persicimonas caeni]
MPSVTLPTRRYVSLCLLSLSLLLPTGCSDPSNEGESPSPVDQRDRPVPSVEPGGQWRQMQGPPMSAHGLGWSSYLLGHVDGQLYLHETHDPPRILMVDTLSGEAQVAGELEQRRTEGESLLQIGQWGDAQYLLTHQATYTRDSGDETWQRMSLRLEEIIEVDGAALATTHHASERHPGSLVRKVDGGDWQLVREAAGEFEKSGQVIHLHQGIYNDIYSTDGGQTWTEHERPYIIAQLRGAASYDGRHWGGSKRPGKVYVSDDGISWEEQEAAELEGALDEVTRHDGRIYAIERGTNAAYVTGEDHIVTYGESGWQRIARPPQTRLLELHTYAETLYAITRSAGVWRMDDSGEGWEPVGPSLDTPTELAGASIGLCALAHFGVLSCRSGGDSEWWREGIDPLRTVEEIHVDGEQLFLVVSASSEPGEAFGARTEIWRMTSDAQVELAVEADAILAASVESVFEHDGTIYVLTPYAFLRIGDDGARGEELFEYNGRRDHSMHGATSMHGEIWLIDQSGLTGWVDKVDDDGERTSRSEGLPAPSFEDDRGPYPVAFARTELDLYTLVQRARLADGGGVNWVGQVFVWDEDQQRWMETPTPSRQELDGEYFEEIHASGDALYALTDSRVYQYDPSRNQWSEMSQGLPDGQIRGFTTHANQAYVSVEGHGMWRYGGN